MRIVGRLLSPLEGSRPRLIAALAVATVAVLVQWLAVPAWVSWVMRGLVAWCAGAGVYLFFAWRMIRTGDAQETSRRCSVEDDSRATIDTLLVVAAVASLAGVLLALKEASKAQGWWSYAVTALSILSVILGWLLVHTLYAMHYARLYYQPDPDDPDGPAAEGMDLHGGGDPDYRDFLYVSLCIACTFGVTDTELTNKHVRRTVAKHALLSFAFATMILGLAVNVVTSLVSGGK